MAIIPDCKRCNWYDLCQGPMFCHRRTIFEKGDSVYYYAPKLHDTVPGKVIKAQKKYDRQELLLDGNFVVGNRKQWVNSDYCELQETV